MDKFKLDAVDIGDLEKIEIGHDGKNPGAGWCLDKVLQTHGLIIHFLTQAICLTEKCKKN